MNWNKHYFSIEAIAIFVVALIPFTVTPVLPLIDFYNHIARFYVLAHVGSSPLLQRYYEAHWALLPDIGVDVLGTPLLKFLPPLFAAKLIAIIILAILYGGALYFHTSLVRHKSFLVPVLLAPLLYSYILNWGFANFLLGLGISFWAAGWWMRSREDLRWGLPVACLLAIAIFFSHGVAFLLYGILLSCLEFGRFASGQDRRFSTLLRSLSLLAVQAVIPVVYFFLWRAGVAGGGTVSTLHLAPIPFSTRLTHALLYHLKTILRVEEGPWLWFDVSTFVAQITGICGLIYLRKISFPKYTHILIFAVVVLAAVPLPTLFGVGYIADRIPLFAALVIVSAISINPGRWTMPMYTCMLLLLIVACCRVAAIAVSWQPYTRSSEEFRQLATKLRPGSLVTAVSVGNGHHENSASRCEMWGPILIAEYGQVGALFADQNQQPLRMIGPLKGSGIYVPITADYNSQIVKALQYGSDDVLVCNTSLLRKPIPDNIHMVARTKNFVLLSRE